jgi:membrane protease YdiL (CAAX protease family)
MRRSKLAILLLATFLITWTCWWTLSVLTVHSGVKFGEPLFMVLFMLGGLGPTVAPYLCLAMTEGRAGIRKFHSRLFRWRVHLLWYVFVLAAPFFLKLLAITINVAVSDDSFSQIHLQPWSLVVPQFFLMILGGGLEELGWRGVALPELQRRVSPFTASVLLGVIWSLWHLPLFSIQGVAQYRTSFLLFSLSTLGITFLMTFLYNRTQSILLCILFHAAFNTVPVAGLGIPESDALGSALDVMVKILVSCALVVFLGRHNKVRGSQR